MRVKVIAGILLVVGLGYSGNYIQFKYRELKKLEQNANKFSEILDSAVLAFNRSESNGGACPKGWSLFEPARGRFIIGAGRHGDSDLKNHPSFKDDQDQAIGGQQETKLSDKNIPSHNHKWIHNSKRQAGASEHGSVTMHEMYDKIKDRRGVDDGEPFDNMPPYVALYFCEKEEKVTVKRK